VAVPPKDRRLCGPAFHAEGLVDVDLGASFRLDLIREISPVRVTEESPCGGDVFPHGD
jgi:hypothetical protein